MSHLGILINIVSGGAQPAVKLNVPKDGWPSTACVSDLRSEFSLLPGLDGSGSVVYRLHFLGAQGTLIGVVLPQNGQQSRPNDHTVAWIHVPAKCKLSGKELLTVVEGVRVAISRLEGIDQKALNKLFDRDYPDYENGIASPRANICSKKEGAPIAVRRYATSEGEKLPTLGQLLEHLAQEGYQRYSGVYLLEETLPITPDAQATASINSPLTKWELLEVPKPQQGFAFSWGVKQAQQQDKTDAPEVKSSAQWFVVGKEYKGTWRCKGYKSVEKSFVVQDEATFLNDVALKENEIWRLVTRKMFVVKNSSGEVLEYAVIYVDKKPLSEQRTYVEEHTAHTLSAKATGYVESSFKWNGFPSEEKPWRLKLNREMGEKQTESIMEPNKKVIEQLQITLPKGISLKELELRDGQFYYIGQMTEPTDEDNDDESPKFGRWIELSMKHWPKLLGGIVVLIIVVVAVWSFYPQKPQKKSMPRVTTEEQRTDSLLNAWATKLDSAKYWTRDLLEEQEKAKGLLDVLSQGKLRNLVDQYGELRNYSSVLESIFKKADVLLRMESTPALKIKLKDGKLDVDEYLKQLDKAEKKAKPSGGAAGGAGSEGDTSENDITRQSTLQ